MSRPKFDHYTVAQTALIWDTEERFVWDAFESGELQLAVLAGELASDRNYQLRFFDEDACTIGESKTIPDYLYFSGLDATDWDYDKKEGIVRIDCFRDIETGNSYEILFLNEHYQLSVSESKVFVTSQMMTLLNREHEVIPRPLVIDRLKKGDVQISGDCDQKKLSPKTKNGYLRLIAALSEVVIDGLTGRTHTDAQAVLSALEAYYNKELEKVDAKSRGSFRFQEPIKDKAFAKYLEEAKALQQFIDFKEKL